MARLAAANVMRAAIVGRKHTERIVCHPETVQCFQQLTYDMIHLEDEVAMGASVGAALEPVGRK